MRARADLSVEVGHMYLDRMTEGVVRREAERAVLWVKPLLDAQGWRNVSTCILLDNYNRFDNPTGCTEQEAVSMVSSAFNDLGLAVDHVVWEASCADTVMHLKEFIVPEPRAGAGSRSGPNAPALFDAARGWLSNGDDPRPARSGVGGGVLQRLPRPQSSRGPLQQHAIALDVQLWADEEERGIRWACPTLAAWWQLIRLGALEQLDPPLAAAPAGTWSRPGANALQARRTLTFLTADYIEVEHAVMNILRQVALPDDWVTTLKESEEVPPPRAQLERIAYIFVPSGFEARWLRRE